MSDKITPDEPIYNCGKCGWELLKGLLAEEHVMGVCGGCARIVMVVRNQPFSSPADLDVVPLRVRTLLEQKADEVRKAKGLPAPILIN